MTRRLRPPARLDVRCGADGLPARVRRGGRERVVTRVVATWVRPAPWWEDVDGLAGADGPGAAPAGPPRGERAYAKIVLDEALVYEIFSVGTGDDGGAAWYVERIHD